MMLYSITIIVVRQIEKERTLYVFEIYIVVHERERIDGFKQGGDNYIHLQ